MYRADGKCGNCRFCGGSVLSGILNAYLVDTFPRKQVCIRSMLLLLLLNFAYVYLSAVWQVFLVRILQGMCFGVTLASTGATLAIDVTPGNKRDQANLCFAWSGVLGMLIGVAVGVWYGTSFSFFTWMCVSALLGEFLFYVYPCWMSVSGRRWICLCSHWIAFFFPVYYCRE